MASKLIAPKNEDMFTLIFAIYTLVVLTFFFLLSLVALFVCYPFDKPRRVVHELSRWLCYSWWYAPFTWRRKIEGLDIEMREILTHISFTLFTPKGEQN